MARSPRYAVDRNPGETYAHFARRAREAHMNDALRAKASEGRWLPEEEYARVTGRPGRATPPGVGVTAGPVASQAATTPSSGARRAGELATVAAMAKGAAFSGALTAAAEVLTHGRDTDVAETAAKALGSAASTAAIGAVRHGAGRALATTALAAAVRSTVGSTALGHAASLAVDIGANGLRVAMSDIDAAEFKRRTAQSAVEAGIGVTCAAVGAGVGSVVPVIGTAVGAAVFGTIGPWVIHWLRE